MPPGFPREIRFPRRYRLLVRPNFTVTFPSIIYVVSIRPVEGAPQYRLIASQPDGRGERHLAQGGDNLARFERELFELGFQIMHPTAASTILEKLVREGRAERLTP